MDRCRVDVGSRVVLVVDPDERIRSLVRLTLDSDSTEVLDAAGLDAALEAVSDHEVQLALVDADLPGGGIDACGRLKAARAGLRTVLLVPKSDLETVDDTAGHVDALLTKPFTSLALLRKVDDVLARR